MYTTKCRLADFNVSFDSDIRSLDKILRDYLCDFDDADFSIGISDKDVELEKEFSKDEGPNVFLTTYKVAALFRKLADQLPPKDTFVMHSACFDVGGVGVAFAAHSGTGKTTHMGLWQQYLGEKMVVVNGDKPIIRFFPEEPDVPYAYGSPWNGKEHFGCNMRTKLKHICFIERSETNYVEKVDKKSAVDRIMKQVYMPQDPAKIVKTMQLIDKLFGCCDLWIIHCNMDPEAAEVAYNTIFGTDK